MRLLDEWAYRGNHSWYDQQLRTLAVNELPAEKWSYAGKNDYGILRNYISYTFQKLSEEHSQAESDSKKDYIYEDEKQACFNTGLFDKNWQQIYFYCIPNNRIQPWKFKAFYNSYTIKFTGIPANAVNKLRRPNYFSDPQLLVFDVNLPITPQWNHIIDDSENFIRIPKIIRDIGVDVCRSVIDGEINRAKKRIEANYKTAVPQWYRGRIQLLAPLYLTNKDIPDLALALSLSDDRSQYYGHTCLTMEMAYNNARLIARPESFWLQP